MDAADLQKIQILLFVCLFSALLLGEVVAPLFPPPVSPWRHARRNLGLTAINGILNKGLIAGIAAMVSMTEINHFGFFNYFSFNSVVELILSLALLDFCNYAMHRLKHAVPFLWRFHKVHHSDPHLNITSSARFHPGETLFTLVFQAGLVFVFGISFWSLMLYFLLMGVAVQLNHANIQLPLKLDRAVRLVFVSPYMHKTHHSKCVVETDSNFSDILSLWDRIFGTYLDRERYDDLKLGLADYADDEPLSIAGMLKAPFTKM